MDIKLTFINRSLAGNGSEVVIFQKNTAMGLQALSVAWKVIQFCGYECTHPFVYPCGYEVGIRDDWGNYSPRLKASAGDTFAVVERPVKGRQLNALPVVSPAGDIQVLNQMQQGAINVCLFKAGRLLGLKTGVAPQQKATFRYVPALWIGAVSGVVEGTAIDSAVVPADATELSLLGVASADIVMTGGGSGPDTGPLAFALENVVPA